MKRIFSFVLALTLLVGLLVGCGDSNGTTSNGGAVNNGIFSTETVSFIDESGESKYTFVRAGSLSTEASSKVMEVYSGLRKTVGIEKMKNINDKATDGVDTYEILVGNTNRPESARALEYLKSVNNGRSRDYIICTIGKKIVINGFSDKALADAATYFVSNYLKPTIEGGILYTYTTVGNFPDITVNGVHLGQFKIVRAAYNFSYLAQMQIDELMDMAENDYAYSLECVTDVAENSEYEVIIGNANRDGVTQTENRDEYAITVSGKKVYLNGGSSEALAMAVAEFAKLIKKGTVSDADSTDGIYLENIKNYDKANYYTYSWGDDFDGDKIDTSKWYIYSEGKGDAEGMNGRKSVRTDDPNYVYVNDGRFYITAGYTNNKYIGGMITTHRNMLYKYGYIEMSALLPDGKGFWTSLWLDTRGHTFWPAPEQSTGVYYDSEIDVNECFGNAKTVQANVHKWPTEAGITQGYDHTALANNEQKYSLEDDANFSGGFHTFGLLWDEDEHTFTCDGNAYFSYTNNSTDVNRDGLHSLSFIRLSAAVGFASLGEVAADDDPAWSQSNQFIVDYVHIYQLQDGKQILLTQ